MANKLILHTDRISEEQQLQVDRLLNKIVPADVEVERYNHHIELTYDEYMKYSKCTSISDMRAVNPEYYNDVTESGVWAYNLDSLGSFTTWSSNEGNWISGLQKSEKVRKVIINAPSYPAYSSNNSCNWFQDMENLEELEFSCKGLAGHGFTNFAKNCPKLKRLKIHIPNAAYIDDIIRNSPLLTYENIEITPNLNEVIRIWGFCSGMDSLKRWTIELPKVNDISWAFSSAGLESFEIGLPSLGSGLGAFAKAILNKESVVRICDSLPADPVTTGIGYSPGDLTLGINKELMHDEAVATAIADATSKGWKINAVFNPATDAANVTYSLRKPPIYARVGEKPCEDGTTERFLVWGHYVTDPTEYKEFSSVEEAREYFGLPEEESI